MECKRQRFYSFQKVPAFQAETACLKPGQCRQDEDGVRGRVLPDTSRWRSRRLVVAQGEEEEEAEVQAPCV